MEWIRFTCEVAHRRAANVGLVGARDVVPVASAAEVPLRCTCLQLL